MSVRRYAQALAWILGDEAVDIEHLRAVLPYASAHRIQWRDEAASDLESGNRKDVLPIHQAREAVRQVFRRYGEQSDRIKAAMAVAFQVYEGKEVAPVEGEHPIYIEIMRDLGVEPERPVVNIDPGTE